MFDLLDRPLHWIAVEWPGLKVPDDNDSELSEPATYVVELRVEIIDRNEAQWRFPAMFPGIDPDDPDEVQARAREAKAEREAEFGGPTPDAFDTFKRVVKEWRKVKANGRVVAMTDENIKLLLRAPMFEAAFAMAYILALGGKAEIREKNSPTSRSDGREGQSEKQPTTNSEKTASASD